MEAVERAAAITPCTCHEAFTNRRRRDPNCHGCEVRETVEQLADEGYIATDEIDRLRGQRARLRAALTEVVEHVDNDTAADWLGNPPSDEDLSYVATTGANVQKIVIERLRDIIDRARNVCTSTPEEDDRLGIEILDEVDQ